MNIKKRTFQILHVITPVLLGVDLLPVVRGVPSVLCGLVIFFIPVLIREEHSGLSIHRKWMCYSLLITLVQALGYAFFRERLLLATTLVFFTVFLFEWRLRAISALWEKP